MRCYFRQRHVHVYAETPGAMTRTSCTIRNHVYPLMSAGWGSTADYILLSDNDTIDLAMFSNWSFCIYGAFARFDKDDYTAKVGEKITFETQKYDTKSVSDGGTESFEPITGLNVKLYNENWQQQQELTSEGSSYTLDTASLKAGTYYLLGYDPNYGTGDAGRRPRNGEGRSHERGISALPVGRRRRHDRAHLHDGRCQDVLLQRARRDPQLARASGPRPHLRRRRCLHPLR